MTAVLRHRLNRGTMGRLRLASQGLTLPGPASVAGAVRWMTAMQAQDPQAALWAVGQRVPGSRVGDVRNALDTGEIVRSWPMRGTLHLLAPEDLLWILAITAGRLIRDMAGRHGELGISAADVDAAADAGLQLVSGGGAASRAELFEAFERAGQSAAGQRGIHLLGILCQRGLLVQGPLAGNQQLVVAFADWIKVSRNLDRAEGIAEWLLRYLRSHGPATERDFSWWAGSPSPRSGRHWPGSRTSWWSWSSGAPATGSLRKPLPCSTAASPAHAPCSRCRASMSSCWAGRRGSSPAVRQR